MFGHFDDVEADSPEEARKQVEQGRAPFHKVPDNGEYVSDSFKVDSVEKDSPE